MVKNYSKPSKDEEEDEELRIAFSQPTIYGSSILFNVITIYGFKYGIADIVKAALVNSRLSLDTWNNLSYTTRDEIIGAQLTMMRARLEDREPMTWLTAVSVRVKNGLVKEKIQELWAEIKDIEAPMPKPMRDRPY